MSKYQDGVVQRLLVELGIEVLDEQGDELVAKCPGHKAKTKREDNNPSWSINAENGVHFCFSCHYKGNLYSLAADIKGAKWARQLLGDDWRAPVETDAWRVNRSLEPPRPGVHGVKPQTMKESELALFSEPPEWALEERGLDGDAAAFYGVLWDTRRDAWVLPIRSPEGALLGYQTKAKRHVRNYPMGIHKASSLFGYVEVVEDGADFVVVVESPLDAVLLRGLGFPAVAVMGSRLSDAQIGMLFRWFARNVVLALDNDDAGRKETDRLLRVDYDLRTSGMSGLRTVGFARVEYQGPEKDFGEMDPRDVVAVLERAGAGRWSAGTAPGDRLSV